MTDQRLRRLRTSGWLALAIPGAIQVLLLLVAMFGRVSYPYDLEWMEGGLLHHAARISDGAGIYVAPSIDFIPYLYTPLYPGLMAAISDITGISYAVGRTISVLSTIATMVLLLTAVRHDTAAEDRHLGWIGGASALGFFAATYPWIEGWYDIVRADSLFLLMVVGGLYGIRVWARSPGSAGLAKLACAAAVLALSFFCKQTGVLFVGVGGVLVLALHWRRAPLYVLVTGLIGLGGTALLNSTTDGWFWTYVYELHQAHDFNIDRFYASFGHMLWHFPAMTLVIAAAFALAVATAFKRRKVPAAGFAIWFPVFVVGLVVGAVGWGTQFAHFNAYIPAMAFGSLAAGCALPGIAACVRQLWPDRSAMRLLAPATCAAALAAQLLLSLWNPGKFVPPDEDRSRGDSLIAAIRDIEGEVYIPYHPWYAELAGKRVHAHFMGLRDVTTGAKLEIEGLSESFRKQRFDAIVMDNRLVGRELSIMRTFYRMDDLLPASQSPRVYTGAGAVWNKDVQRLIPRSIWIPARPLNPPDGVSVWINFESGSYGDWKTTGSAWGRRPSSRPLAKQGPVRRYGGRYFATSYHGQDKATGTLASPRFVVDASEIWFRIGGGRDPDLRAELVVAGEVVKEARGENSEAMREIVWNVAPYNGQEAQLRFVDEATGSWGHLNVDEIWIRKKPIPDPRPLAPMPTTPDAGPPEGPDAGVSPSRP